MGGDHAPECVVLGARDALAEFDFIEKLVLVGDETLVKAEVDKIGFNDRRMTICHADEVVGMGESAVKAVRTKKKSSISIGCDLVKGGDCNALVSAGNTGAVVAASTIKLRNLKGVERSGIASPIPNEHGPCYILDAGANVDAKASHLVQYAIMGSTYARHMQGKDKPVVGLMSVGVEDEKGSELTKEVFERLKASSLNFCGNVEGHDLFETELDVVVCDGFTGNVMLKTCEATAKIMFKWLKNEIMNSAIRQLGAMLSKGAFKATMARGSYETYGGSPLLGVNGTVIIAHGSSSERAVKNAIRVAANAVRKEVNPHIEEEIAKHQATD